MSAHPALDVRFPVDPPADVIDRVETAVHAHDPLAIDEGSSPDGRGAPPAAWRVYFATAEDRDRARADLLVDLDIPGLTIVAVDVPDEPWAERSQGALGAVRIGGVTVAPPWDSPTDAPGPVIVIQPSRGFGTGHHASTRLCLLGLQRLDVTDRAVLDLGTGSGVLAIAAVRLGASTVTAVDCDPDALDSARDNLALNGVSDRVRLVRADLADLRPASSWPIVLANLTAGVLERYADVILSWTTPGGALVAGGITTDQARTVAAAFERGGSANVVDRLHEDDWETLILNRHSQAG